MTTFGTEPVTIIRRTAASVDEYGNPTYTTREIVIREALFAFGTTNEPLDTARNPIDAKLTLYFPHGTVIEEGDLFKVRDVVWMKDGEAAAWPTVEGFNVGVIVQVRKRRG